MNTKSHYKDSDPPPVMLAKALRAAPGASGQEKRCKTFSISQMTEIATSRMDITTVLGYLIRGSINMPFVVDKENGE